MHDTYMKPVSTVSKDVLIEVPETDDWLQAYLHRGWELVDKDGKQMLRYPAEMGTPLYPRDTVPFWNAESPPPRKGKKAVRKDRR